jgi:acetyl esterase/lipase
MGFAVINAEYRLAKSALAPAAVEDALLAVLLRFYHSWN